MSQQEHNPKRMLSELSFCVFDLETTGGNHNKDRIIEIGLVKIKNLKIVDTKSYLINPEIKIPDFIQKLTSIKQSDLTDSPRIEEVIDDILDFMGDSILVAHNASFDVPFFNSVLNRLKKEKLKNKSICTNLMTKYLIPNLMNSNLNYMSKIFKITHKKAHRALDDAKATAKLFIKYLNIFIQKDIQKINHLYYPKNKYELDRTNIYNTSKQSGRKVLNFIKKLEQPYMFMAKGPKGIINFALPCSGTEKEIEFIKEELKDKEWNLVTIRLHGPFIETLIQFNRIYSKIDPAVRDRVLDFLKSNYTSSENYYNLATASVSDVRKDLGEFVIYNHLVPEQFVILPLLTLDQKNKLIFRYPGHQKRLQQFLNSKFNFLKGFKKIAPTITPELLEVIYSYVFDNLDNKEFIVLKEDELGKKNYEEIHTRIATFQETSENPYNFPQNYI